MIRDDGWVNHCIWEHSRTVRELYARRCRLEEEEMTCAAQAAELLAPLIRPGDTVLDVGCGSGYFFHSLRKRGLPARYVGIDAAPSLIAIGREYLPRYGLPPDHLRVLRIEDLDGSAEHVVCLNVLSNIDNYHRPLERILKCARRTAVIRESCKAGSSCAYVRDDYLDPGCDLKVYVNAYDTDEFMRFIAGHGFRVRRVIDRRAQDRPELVIGHPHYWTFFVAERL